MLDSSHDWSMEFVQALLASNADWKNIDVSSRNKNSAISHSSPTSLRWQDDKIIEFISGFTSEGVSVLDLGCGDGELLARLRVSCKARVQGVEKNPLEVKACIKRGIPVFHVDLDGGLAGLSDNSFDVVVLEETLQTLIHPDLVLSEMLRVGKIGIVSFPNFASWRVRLHLLFEGRMPNTDSLPHRWYNTPNIHLCTLDDFFDLASEKNISVIHGWVLVDGKIRALEASDNLHADEALLILRKSVQ